MCYAWGLLPFSNNNINYKSFPHYRNKKFTLENQENIVRIKIIYDSSFLR